MNPPLRARADGVVGPGGLSLLLASSQLFWPCGWVDPSTSTVAAMFLLPPPSRSVAAHGSACEPARSARRSILSVETAQSPLCHPHSSDFVSSFFFGGGRCPCRVKPILLSPRPSLLPPYPLRQARACAFHAASVVTLLRRPSFATPYRLFCSLSLSLCLGFLALVGTPRAAHTPVVCVRPRRALRGVVSLTGWCGDLAEASMLPPTALLPPPSIPAVALA